MFDSPYRAAVIQMNSTTDPDTNFGQAYRLLREAAAADVKVAGLPENFAFLGGLSMRMNRADEITVRAAEFLSETAWELGLYILGGSYPVPAAGGKVYNRSALYGPGGEKLIHYDKIHLFDVALSESEAYRESAYIEAGDLRAPVYRDEAIGCWGLSICYDLRFPEHYRKLAEQEVQVLSVPSAFTHTTGRDHWKPLLRARAIENTSYVVAPAQTGQHGNNRETWGHALIIDPWGRVVADAGTNPGIAIAEIEPEQLHRIRAKIPSLNHRRW